MRWRGLGGLTGKARGRLSVLVPKQDGAVVAMLARNADCVGWWWASCSKLPMAALQGQSLIGS